MTSAPHISVIIPTRNRPEDLSRCLESLRSVEYASWDTLVVDQSDGEATQRLVCRYQEFIQGLTVQRSDERGLTLARNAGIASTGGTSGSGIIAFLDDDCTVASDWLEQVAAAFLRHPHASLVFGSVAPAAYDPEREFLPQYVIPREHEIRSLRAFLRRDGDRCMGAAMYFRRSLIPRIGDFDQYLDSGAALFPACGDTDLFARAVLAHEPVVRTPAITILHHGIRALEGGKALKLQRDSARAFAGMHLKFLRCGHLLGLLLLAKYIRLYAQPMLLRRPVGSAELSHRASLSCYVQGLVASFKLGVNRKRCLYRERSSRSPR